MNNLSICGNDSIDYYQNKNWKKLPSVQNHVISFILIEQLSFISFLLNKISKNKKKVLNDI